MRTFGFSQKNSIFFRFLAIVFIFHLTLFLKKISKIQPHSTKKTSSLSQKKIKIVQMTSQELKNFEQKKQVVQSEDSHREDFKKDSYLSDKNRSFDKQTAAKIVDKFNLALKANSLEDVYKSPNKKTVVNRKNKIKNLKLSDFGFDSTFKPSEFDFEKKEVQNQNFPQKGIKTTKENAKGIPSTNDYLRDVTLGDFTQLNTVEYKHYGFFLRIKQRLEQFWGQTLKQKTNELYKAGRFIASQEDYITSLIITLNEKGEIIHVKIKSTSGVKELDDAAIESFNNAGPFPNPPQELLKNGRAILEWGFVVKT